MNPKPLDFRNAHKHCAANRHALIASHRAGCFYCLEIFDSKEITEWIPDTAGKTAVCPYCGIDSVLPESADYPLTAEFLGEMRRYWFE